MKKMNNNFRLAALWFIASLFFSSINDIITKHLGDDLNAYIITFWRAIFGALVLIPLLFKKRELFYTNSIIIHLIRGLILFIAISMWAHGLLFLPIANATVITFTIPIFILILARIFLKEEIDKNRVFATILGFVGIITVLNPDRSSFNPESLMLLGSAVMFASLDIINKIFIVKESMVSMIFYSALATAFFALIPSYFNWVLPNMNDLFLLFILGSCGNLILYCILKAFHYNDASAVAPFRYLELLFTLVLAALLLGEFPNVNTLYGSIIIIPSTAYIAWAESLKSRRKNDVKV